MTKSRKMYPLAYPLGLAIAVAASTMAFASEAEFFKGKNINLVIGTSPGGGYDTYSRLIGRHMGRHIPGKPNIIARNMPGAGGLKSANFLYNRAPRDGTAFGTFSRGIIAMPLFGNKKAKFDSSKFTWLGSANSATGVFAFWHKSGITSIEHAKKRSFVMGGTTAGTTTVDAPNISNNLLGTKFKIVVGYPGGGLINLAMERGEVEGRYWSYSSILATQGKWLKEGKLKIVLQLALEKHPQLQDVPLIMDMVKNEGERQVLRMLLSENAYARAFMAPPKLAPARAASLRRAFDATMKDAKFLKGAKKQKIIISAITGEKVEQLIAAVYATPKDIIVRAKAAATRSGLTKMVVKKFPWITVKGTITKIRRGGRRLGIKLAGGNKGKVKVSGRKSKITVAGKKAKRKHLKVGMRCDFTWQGSGTTAKKIACK